MILPLVLSLAFPLDKSDYFDRSIQERHFDTMDIKSVQAYQYTTKDINPNPSDYIRMKNSSLLYEKLGEELLQDEEDNK